MALEPRDTVLAAGWGGGGPGAAAGEEGPDRTGAEPRHLSPQVRTVWRLGGVATCAVLAAAIGVLAAVVGDDARLPVLAAGGVAVAGALAGALVGPGLRWDRWTYRLGPAAIEMRYGVVVRRASTVPYFRVQHIDLVTGPIDRAFGLTTLHLRTASATTAATIPGLDEAEAEALRLTVLRRAGRDDAV